MKLTFLPKTKFGKRSVYLAILSFLFGLLGSMIPNLQGNTIEYPNPINSPLLGTVLYLTFIVAGIAFIYSLVAVIKSKERAILVYLILLIHGYFSIMALLFLIIGTFQSFFK